MHISPTLYVLYSHVHLLNCLHHQFLSSLYLYVSLFGLNALSKNPKPEPLHCGGPLVTPIRKYIGTLVYWLLRCKSLWPPIPYSMGFRSASLNTDVGELPCSVINRIHQNINFILSKILYHVVRGTFVCVDGFDPYLKILKISIDLLADFGDFPASIPCVHVMEHTALTLSMCSLGRRKLTSHK